MKVLKYKGYFGNINQEQGIFWGKVLLLDNDVITYESEDYDGLVKEFKLAVEDYLLFCEEENKLPEKTIIEEVE